MTKLRCTVRWMQQTTAPWCLFDSTTKEVNSTNIALGHLLLKTTSKRLDKEKAHFNCFNKSCI